MHGGIEHANIDTCMHGGIEMDDSVGQILSALDRLGVVNNTLVRLHDTCSLVYMSASFGLRSPCSLTTVLSRRRAGTRLVAQGASKALKVWAHNPKTHLASRWLLACRANL
jgi:arylsulfatase A-like enzyme